MFAQRIHRILKLGLNIEDDALAEVDANMPPLEEDASLHEERKMEEVD